MKIKDHLLENIPYVASPNYYGKFIKNLPDTLVVHYTAGPSLDSAKNTFLNKESKASAHVIIDRDGSMVQMVPFDTIAWHAGESQWGKRKGLNNYSIGIELVNAGALVKEKTGFSSWFGKTYTNKEVVKAIHRNEELAGHWHKYTEKQINACKSLAQLLMEQYGIKEILGHEEISTNGKIDPGPAFPLDTMRNTLFSEKSQIKNAKVCASSLNIRFGPGTEYEAVAAPLPPDHPVEILERKGGWVKVKTMAVVEGWVAKRYLR